VPTYQYACTECDHAFEQFQSFSDDALTVCPQCAGRLRKVFNAVGVVFKGSGFYRTDSRASGSSSEGSPASNGSEKSGADKSGSGKAGGDKTGATPSGTGEKSTGTKTPSTTPAA
jgi:putative FmdB family regulatory protein